MKLAAAYARHKPPASFLPLMQGYYRKISVSIVSVVLRAGISMQAKGWMVAALLALCCVAEYESSIEPRNLASTSTFARRTPYRTVAARAAFSSFLNNLATSHLRSFPASFPHTCPHLTTPFQTFQRPLHPLLMTRLFVPFTL